MAEAQQMECLNCGVKFSRRKYSASQRAAARFCSRKCGITYRYGTPAQRFMEAVSPEPNSGCWLWTKYLDRNGYGLVGNGSDQIFAHRFAYAAFVGPLVNGMLVCHHCDNPTCVNPDHLFQATHRVNMDDMVAKQRHKFGSQHHNARLTESDVKEIRFFSSIGQPTRSLASLYQVSERTIRNARQGTRWGHVK